MIGIIVNVISVAVGGVCGTLFGHKMSQAFTEKLTCVFGVCAMGMGISSIVLMENMPAVILAIVVGTALGLALHVGDWIVQGASLLQKPIARILAIRKPVAMSRKPPQALKSAIITGVVRGKITLAMRNSARKITAWGTATTDTTAPREQANTMAVKKSRTDLDSRMVASPVMPASRLP